MSSSTANLVIVELDQLLEVLELLFERPFRRIDVGQLLGAAEDVHLLLHPVAPLVALLLAHVGLPDPVGAVDERLLGRDVLLQLQQRGASSVVEL